MHEKKRGEAAQKKFLIKKFLFKSMENVRTESWVDEGKASAWLFFASLGISNEFLQLAANN